MTLSLGKTLLFGVSLLVSGLVSSSHASPVGTPPASPQASASASSSQNPERTITITTDIRREENWDNEQFEGPVFQGVTMVTFGATPQDGALDVHIYDAHEPEPFVWVEVRADTKSPMDGHSVKLDTQRTRLQLTRTTTLRNTDLWDPSLTAARGGAGRRSVIENILLTNAAVRDGLAPSPGWADFPLEKAKYGPTYEFMRALLVPSQPGAPPPPDLLPLFTHLETLSTWEVQDREFNRAQREPDHPINDLKYSIAPSQAQATKGARVKHYDYAIDTASTDQRNFKYISSYVTTP